MTLIKICGITSYADAKLALDLGADALGFNFSAASPRKVTAPEAQAIVRRLPAQAWIVGVFVNQPRAVVEQLARTVPLDTLQFHGDEDLEYCSGWREWRTLKAIRLRDEEAITLAAQFAPVVSHLLFDSFSTQAYGGTGIELEPALLASLMKSNLHEHALLSGGLTPANVATKLETLRPLGVDVASGVELNPRVKSPEKMKAFIDAVRLVST